MEERGVVGGRFSDIGGMHGNRRVSAIGGRRGNVEGLGAINCRNLVVPTSYLVQMDRKDRPELFETGPGP